MLWAGTAILPRHSTNPAPVLYLAFDWQGVAGSGKMVGPANAGDRIERARLLEVILKTRDADGTWNDRVFPRSRNYGTAMVVLALLGENTPIPPAYRKR